MTTAGHKLTDKQIQDIVADSWSMSQRAVARKHHVAQSLVSYYRKTREPSDEELDRIALSLNEPVYQYGRSDERM